jgi:hypothetical protein
MAKSGDELVNPVTPQEEAGTDSPLYGRGDHPVARYWRLMVDYYEEHRSDRG